MQSADIRLVVGTRPEAIKLAPLAKALAEQGIPPTLVLTGQHAALDPREFGFTGLPVERLGCVAEPDPHRHVQSVADALLPRLAANPGLVVVQGDTSSALGSALAGFAAGVPVAHVEAGLRTHDPRLPWPEEEYRVAIDAQAELLFAPTHGAAEHLRAERVPGEIYVTGNTGVDAAVAAEAKLPPPPVRKRSQPLIVVTCHRRESWGERLSGIAAAVAELARNARVEFILHPNPSLADRVRALLGHAPNVSLIPPRSHAELLHLIRDADLVLSDSGGIQEEAPGLGVPLLVLRDKTERPEGVAAGNALLVGTCGERIVAEGMRLLNDPVALAMMSRRCFPYGDGRAAPRIAAIVRDWLERKRGNRRTARPDG